jgi:iron complex transport system ATP-binding protein
MSSKAKFTSSILTANSLSIGYKDKRETVEIASQINFDIQPGELVALIGINGSGKSTLLKTLSGIIPALTGDILIDNTSISSLQNKDLASKQSLVLTNEIVSKQLSVFELVALGRHPYTNWLGHLSQKDLNHVDEAIKQVGLLQNQHKTCDALSDGQFQKVLIARALAQNTPLILMDEPTTHLDMYHKAYVLQLLKSIVKRSQKSILYASHEINLALQLCDKIILIDQGKVTYGRPSDLIQKGTFNSLFPKDLIVFDEISQSFRMKINTD